MEMSEAKQWIFSEPVKSIKTRILCNGCKEASAIGYWYYYDAGCRFCDEEHGKMECPNCNFEYEVPTDQIIQVVKGRPKNGRS